MQKIIFIVEKIKKYLKCPVGHITFYFLFKIFAPQVLMVPN